MGWMGWMGSVYVVFFPARGNGLCCFGREERWDLCLFGTVSVLVVFFFLRWRVVTGGIGDADDLCFLFSSLARPVFYPCFPFPYSIVSLFSKTWCGKFLRLDRFACPLRYTGDPSTRFGTKKKS
jgi:hypothetical protein